MQIYAPSVPREMDFREVLIHDFLVIKVEPFKLDIKSFLITAKINKFRNFEILYFAQKRSKSIETKVTYYTISNNMLEMSRNVKHFDNKRVIIEKKSKI